jgi:hypothetical protein
MLTLAEYGSGFCGSAWGGRLQPKTGVGMPRGMPFSQPQVFAVMAFIIEIAFGFAGTGRVNSGL